MMEECAADQLQLFLLIKSFTVPVPVLDPPEEEWQVPCHPLCSYLLLHYGGRGIIPGSFPPQVPNRGMTCRFNLQASLSLKWICLGFPAYDS